MQINMTLAKILLLQTKLGSLHLLNRIYNVKSTPDESIN